MGKDWLVWDVISDDRRRAFKYFVANFGNFCKMEDLVNPVDRQKINYLSSSYLQWSQHYLGEEPIIQRTHSFLSQFHQVRHMNPAPKEIFVELDLSPNPSRSNHHMLRFQVELDVPATQSTLLTHNNCYKPRLSLLQLTTLIIPRPSSPHKLEHL